MRRSILLLAAAALALTPAAAQQLATSIRRMSPRRSATIPSLCRSLAAPRPVHAPPMSSPIGRRVGAYSGVANPGQALHFTTLNSAVENAFSVPGGYVYVTRQLMGLMDDESQLAFALGHEVGHVAANHAHIREQYAQRNRWRASDRLLARSSGGNAADVFERARSQLDTLSFSREQEYQADTLGLRYMIAAGYDPAGGAGILAALSRADRLQERVSRVGPTARRRNGRALIP